MTQPTTAGEEPKGRGSRFSPLEVLAAMLAHYRDQPWRLGAALEKLAAHAETRAESELLDFLARFRRALTAHLPGDEQLPEPRGPMPADRDADFDRRLLELEARVVLLERERVTAGLLREVHDHLAAMLRDLANSEARAHRLELDALRELLTLISTPRDPEPAVRLACTFSDPLPETRT